LRFSVQQIKYDFLYAIKEFDSDGRLWGLITSPLPPAETLTTLGHAADDFVYLGKPAGTPRAAGIVKTFFMQRFGVADAGDMPGEGELVAEWVILFRSKKSLPKEADMLEPAGTTKA
jgi:hypothetical protein